MVQLEENLCHLLLINQIANKYKGAILWGHLLEVHARGSKDVSTNRNLTLHSTHSDCARTEAGLDDLV